MKEEFNLPNQPENIETIESPNCTEDSIMESCYDAKTILRPQIGRAMHKIQSNQGLGKSTLINPSLSIPMPQAAATPRSPENTVKPETNAEMILRPQIRAMRSSIESNLRLAKIIEDSDKSNLWIYCMERIQEFLVEIEQSMYGNVESFALTELKSIGMTIDSDDEMTREMTKGILDIVGMFSGQNHSGFSAAYAISILENVLRLKPLSPLTGADDEWMEITYGSSYTLFQNKRCGRVFKEIRDGVVNCYDIDGKVFTDKDGCNYTSRDSRVPVVFPYIPRTEYVKDHDKDGNRLEVV